MKIKQNISLLLCIFVLGIGYSQLQKTEASILEYKNKINHNFEVNNLDSCVYFSRKLIQFGRNTKDTSAIAEGFFNLGYSQKKQFKVHEAYGNFLEALTYTAVTQDSLKAASILINISQLQNEVGDYLGAQNSAVTGLKYLKTVVDSSKKRKLYINLGNAFQNKADYKNAISSYKSSLQYTKNLEKKANAYNNIGNCYRKQAQFDEAIKTYKLALKDSAVISAQSKARLFDNLGMAVFKTMPEKGILILLKALTIRQAENDAVGLNASYIHLSQAYFNTNPNTSLSYAEKAYNIGELLRSPETKREALSYIIQLKENDTIKTKLYVKLTDSISQARNQSLNAFAGIRFRTEELESNNQILRLQNENEKLVSKEEKQQKWFFIAAFLIALLISFLLFRKFQQEKKDRQTILLQKNKIELLQKELHHRLKNNLSFIDLFIGLAKGKFKNPAYQEKLNELQHRINSMFMVHQQLFKSDETTLIFAKSYTESLVQNIMRTYDTQNIAIDITIDGSFKITTVSSFPIGLIINEFLTNSLKYAFPETRKGIIFISLTESDDSYKLKLSDNGVGLPREFDIANLNSFGLDSMRLLAEEYQGTFLIDGKKGVAIHITLPKLAA